MSTRQAAPADLEWQVAEGSRTLHLIDGTVQGWRNADGSRRLSGPRSLCGRYPQRNADGIWFSLDAQDPVIDRNPLPYTLHACPDCRAALDALSR